MVFVVESGKNITANNLYIKVIPEEAGFYILLSNLK